MAILRQSYACLLLNYRSPAQIINLEQSTQTHHETRHTPDHVLRDWHCDQNEDSKVTFRDRAYGCSSVALSVHIFGEVVCSLSIARLEGKINLSRCRESVAQFVVLPKEIGICNGILVEQFEDRH